MVLQMLCSILRPLPSVRIVAAATALHEIVPVCNRGSLDLLIVDAGLDGDRHYRSWEELIERHPLLKCIALTDGREPLQCSRDVAPVVWAAVDKSESPEVLLDVIRNAVGDGSTISAGMPEPALLSRLTRRERDVFNSLGSGMSNKEIAKELLISVQTVETHRKSISRKLGCNGASLIRMAALSRESSLP